MKSYAGKFLSLFLKGLSAGIILSVGISAYIASTGSVFGMILLSFSFFMIYALEFPTYTGKICSVINGKSRDIPDLIPIAIGNTVSVFCFGKLLLTIGKGANFRAAAYNFCRTRISDSLISLTVSAILCGVVICFAIYGANKFRHKNAVIAAAFCIAAAVFVTCRFEHSLIDAYCFTLARVWSADTVCRFICIALGNAVGGIFTSIILKLTEIYDKSKTDTE